MIRALYLAGVVNLTAVTTVVVAFTAPAPRWPATPLRQFKRYTAPPEHHCPRRAPRGSPFARAGRRHRIYRARDLTPLWADTAGGSSSLVSSDDADRARINEVIARCAASASASDSFPMEDLEACLDVLLKGNLYRQTMDSRLARVRSDEEEEELERVDAFLTGYLGQERRRASRQKVQGILIAATESPEALDKCVRDLGAEGRMDGDLQEYLESLVAGEERKVGEEGSLLLRVLKTVQDRVKAEVAAGGRPEIGTLARALQVADPEDRKRLLAGAFLSLEELNDFVKFVANGINYFGDAGGMTVLSNLPVDRLDRMKAVYAEAVELRKKYWQ